MSMAGDWRRMPSLFTEHAVVANPAIEQPIVGRDAIVSWVETWADEVRATQVEWVHWHSTQRLHGYLGDVPPAEFEAAFYAAQHSDQHTVGIR
jgi:transposase InsO family protein